MIKKLCTVSGLIMAVAILLSACGTPQVTLPTADLNLVRTEAAQTVVAQMTREAVLVQPSATQTVAMGMPSPMSVTATSPILSGGTSGGSGGSSGGSYSGTPIPTSTPIIYKAQWVRENYYDGYKCTWGWPIDYIQTVKNIGAATWDTTYYYKVLDEYYYRENKEYPYDKVKEPETIATNKRYFLKKAVAPGETVDLVIDIICPYVLDVIHTTEWGLVNDNGEVFYRFWFGFYSVTPAPAVPTATKTAAPG